MIRSSLSACSRTQPLGHGWEAEEGTEDFWASHSVVRANPLIVPAPIRYLDTDRYNGPATHPTLGMYPGRYSCGISSVLMTDPVRLSSNICFERAEITAWLDAFQRLGQPLRDPNGNVRVDGELTPDDALREEIAAWRGSAEGGARL